MTIRRLRPYRLLRVALALVRIFPRYAWLLARRRVAGEASQASWDRVHAAAAAELKAVALALEGAFTKAAQIGGARADVLPPAFIDELSQFHDAVPARPFEMLRPIVERDLASPISSVFTSLEPEAMAAASLAQVHRARLRDGSDVVVKIQYPEIRRLMPLDLGMLRRVARLTRLLQRRIDLHSLILEVTRFIERELDFEQEVVSMERLRVLLAANPNVVVPRVAADHCGPNLIVMEYLEGIQVSRIDELVEAGHKPSEIARRLGGLYGEMIFEAGFFHGDPHPGNLLVLPDARIGLLDFGLCKELPKEFASATAHMIVSALIGDSPAALSAARQLGFDIQRIEAENLRSLFLLMIGDSDTDTPLLDMLGDSEIRQIPEDFALVLRTLVLLNGLSHRLAPGRRLIQAELLKHLAAGAASRAA